ncbi:MAG: hypothetical protein JF592_15435 [Microbacterium sp.]|uniref:hypothetical protein n=1 Tax=Microbacterium sp. TaxID=51671 RepID=UPI001D747EA3|nr:hypothetical protein [Microbacterium sp.]MBW8763950.1 hypothetical protein [Microbacterium sp.]
MHTDDLATVLASGYATLKEARAVETPQPAVGTRGQDRAGHVEVAVDGHGLLTGVVFSDGIDELRPAELESALLEALQSAHDATGRTRVRSLPEIGNSEVSSQARRILGMEGD